MNNSNYAKISIGVGTLLILIAIILAYKNGGLSTIHFVLFIISSLAMMIGGFLFSKK